MHLPTVSQVGSSAESVRDQVEQGVSQATREARPWVTRLGRFGFAAKGVVYFLVGLYAIQAALGVGGGTTDTRGAMRSLLEYPFGRQLMVVVAAGLAGYALWRFIQATLDTEHKGSDLKGLWARGAYVVICIVYGGLALWALGLSLGSDDGRSSDSSTQDGTALLLSQPFGQWLVAAAAIAALGLAVAQFYRAYSGKFTQSLRLAEMNATHVRWVRRIGQLGFTARGIVFGVVGVFLLAAARQAEPGQARGLGGALTEIAAQPEGSTLLGLVGLGLMAYGLFMLVEARYRRMVM